MQDKREIIKIEPILNPELFLNKKKIHPVLDFDDENAYFGIWLDSMVYYSETEKEVQKVFWILRVGKDGEKELLDPKTMIENYDFVADIPQYTQLFNKISREVISALMNPSLIEDIEEYEWTIFNKEDIKKFLLISEKECQDVMMSSNNKGIKHIEENQDDKMLSNNNKYVNINRHLDIMTLIKEVYEDYLDVMDKRTYTFLSLWTIGTYLHPLFSSFPYIYVGGIKSSGKTKTLFLTKQMAWNGIMSASCSSSSVFRIIHLYKPTLFIDESEPLSSSRNMPDLTYILNSGYKKGAHALRVEQKSSTKQFETKEFDLYSPKMLANIKGLDNVLSSRTIQIIMRRTSKKQGEREINENNPIFKEIRDNIFLFVAKNWHKIKEIYDNFKNETGLSNRDYELWKPIFSIAKFISDDVFKEMVEYARDLTKARHEEEETDNADNILVSVILSYIRIGRTELTSKEIIEAMKLNMEDSDWINSRWVGVALKRLGFPMDKKHKKRTSSGRVYIFEKDDVEALAKAMHIEEEAELPMGEVERAMEEDKEKWFEKFDKQIESQGGFPSVSSSDSPAVEYVDMTGGDNHERT